MTLDVQALSYGADGRLTTTVTTRVTGSVASGDDTYRGSESGRI